MSLTDSYLQVRLGTAIVCPREVADTAETIGASPASRRRTGRLNT